MDKGEEILQGYKDKKMKPILRGNSVSNSIKIEAKYYSNKIYDFPEFSSPNQEHLGFCICCGIQINELDSFLLHVRCYSCYTEIKEEDVIGRYCHCCGYKNKSTLKRPVCYNCYQQIKKDVMPVSYREIDDF